MNDIIVTLNSFSTQLTLTCHKCESDVGILPVGFGMLFVRAEGVPRDFIALAPQVDCYTCRQGGVTATPLMVDPEMFTATLEHVRSFIYVHNPTLDEFRKEFPITPLHSALIKESIRIHFPDS